MNSPDPGNRSRPLRMRLLLLAASGLLPLVIVLGWGIDHLVAEGRRQTERSVLELSRALATSVDGELRGTVRLLEHMANDGDLERADLRAFQMTALRTSEQLGWRTVTIADAEGRLLLRTTESSTGVPLKPREPESIRQVIATQRPVIGRVVDTEREPGGAFAVRVPVMREGKLVYILSAVLPTSLIGSVLTRQNIPTGTVVAIFDQSNHRVARSNQTQATTPSPSLQRLLDGDQLQGVGTTTTRERVDSYTGYTRLPGSRWVVAVGHSVEEANKGLQSLLRAVALGLATSLGLAVFLAWVLSRRIIGPIEALKDGAAALGRGDPVDLPPLDIVELDDVAGALTAAAADRDRAASQIKAALRTAEEANQSKDQFLAVLGHELRNPLAPIATAVQVMELKGDEKTAQERRIIQRQLVHVTRLVDDLLDVSRITSGRLAIRREPVHLGLVLTQVVETIQQSLFRRSLSLDIGEGAEQAWVAGDEVRLAQIFNNLLVNAIKFTPAGGSIHVRASTEGALVRIDVEDNGAGISAAELGRVFELFYQAPQSSDRARGGLGLGLPIVRSLLDMHGGSVTATSDGLDQGTCVTVRLPLCEAPAARKDAPRAVAPRGAGKVLVVDDNEDAADTCATLLEMSGYHVRVAYSPDAALETIREFTPQIAILDIGLPGMSGYALARLMKAGPISYAGRLVALTGYGQAADMAASQDAGFDAHLTKPVTPSDLLELVERLLQPDAQAASQPAT